MPAQVHVVIQLKGKLDISRVVYLITVVVRYECEESFTTLNVDIRNHQNLLDSMEQYVKGDLLEGANAYHCEKCNKKVRLLFLKVKNMTRVSTHRL